eukprot:XP_025012733.1 major pollen allergen Que a 1-like [Ricinus communis]
MLYNCNPILPQIPSPSLCLFFLSPKAIMAVVTHESEIATAIPAAKMFKVFVLEADSIIPKILPQVIKSVEILEGNGGLEPLRRLHSQKVANSCEE